MHRSDELLKNSDLTFSNPRYVKLMKEARLNFHKYVPFVINQLLKQGKEINEGLIEPSSIWELIQNIFDGVMRSKGESELIYYKERFKNEVLRVLFKAGIPFVDGRIPVFWSTRFARKEATKFAIENGGVTDCMAQEYLNKLLVGQDGEYNILFPLANPSLDASVKSEFPRLVKVFCGARAEIFAEEIAHDMDAHLFFQDSLRLDNFFWNYELPIIRARGAKIILHCYDINSHRWQSPINMDSQMGQQVFLKRRSVYPGEPHHPNSVYKEGNGLLLWKQTFKNDSLTEELENWAGPKTLTLDRLSHIFHFWLEKSHRKKPQETALSECNDCVDNRY